MLTAKSKGIAFLIGGLLLAALPFYATHTLHNELDERIRVIERDIEERHSQNRANMDKIMDQLGAVAERVDITVRDVKQDRKIAETLKSEHRQATQQLRSRLDSSAKDLDQFKQEAVSKLEAVQQDTTTRFGTVSGEVQNVRTDLDATKTDLMASRREIGDVRDSLSRQIAHNSTELAELRRRGERDYFEFDVRKSKEMERIGDVMLQLKKADVRRQRYDVVVLVNDNKVEKKDRIANEPVTFLMGRDRLRYELVVNYVDKDRIRGYISAPKDKVLSAEGPSMAKP